MRPTAADIKDAVYTTIEARLNGNNVPPKRIIELKQKAKNISPELYRWVCERL